MSRSSIEIEELLTGLIDGQLSDAERREVESRLERDDSAQRLLRTLQRNRRSIADLPQVASPRFDSRIVAMAQERTKQSHAPGWLAPPSVRRASKHSQIWRKHGLLLGLAASLAMIAVGAMTYVMLREGSANGHGTIAKVTDPLSPEVRPDERVSQGDVEQATPQIAQSNGSGSQLVNPTETPNKSPDLGPTAIASNGNSITDPIVTTLPKDLDTLPTVNPNVENNVAKVESHTSVADDSSGDLLLIIDITIRKDSDAMEVLSDTFAQHDIAMAQDLDIDQAMVDRLEKARLADGPLGDQRRAEGAASTSLVFVKARASRLDAAIEQIFAAPDYFPEFSFDMTIEQSEIELFKELRHVQEAKLSPAQQNETTVSVASPLRAGSAGRAFVGMARRQKSVDPAARTRGQKPSGAAELIGNSGNPVSHVLFVVRTPN